MSSPQCSRNQPALSLLAAAGVVLVLGYSALTSRPSFHGAPGDLARPVVHQVVQPNNCLAALGPFMAHEPRGGVQITAFEYTCFGPIDDDHVLLGDLDTLWYPKHGSARSTFTDLTDDMMLRTLATTECTVEEHLGDWRGLVRVSFGDQTVELARDSPAGWIAMRLLGDKKRAIEARRENTR